MTLNDFCKRLLQGKKSSVEDIIEGHFDRSCLEVLKQNPKSDSSKVARKKLFHDIVGDEKLFRSFQVELRKREKEKRQLMCTHASLAMNLHRGDFIERLGELALKRRTSILTWQHQENAVQNQALLTRGGTLGPGSKSNHKHPVNLFKRPYLFAPGQVKSVTEKDANGKPNQLDCTLKNETFIAPDEWKPIGKRRNAARQERK